MQRSDFYQYRISPLTLGTVQLGMDYGVSNRSGAPDLETSFSMLDDALLNGITAFDTAPVYGNSEAVLGAYFEQQKTDYLIISKFKFDRRWCNDLENAWKEVKKQVEESLQRLKLRRLPLALYHKASDESMDQVMEMVPKLIGRLKEDGLVERGGLSLYFSADANGVDTDPEIEALQIPLNVLDQSLIHSGELDRLHQRGILIFIRSVFLQGLLFRNPETLDGELVKARPYLTALQELAQEAQLSVAELAFGFIRDLSSVDSLVIGAETRKQIGENIRLLNGPRVPEKTRAALSDLVLNIPQEVITPGMWGLKF